MITEGTMEVEMSQAIAGARGTRFILTETGTESKVEVTEGTVAFTSKTTGNEVLVTAGEAVIATAEGLGEKTTFDPTIADAELVEETSAVLPPLPTPVPDTGTPTESEQDEDNSFLTYAFWGVTLIAMAGGVLIGRRWMVKK